MVFEEGDEGDNYYLVLDGEVEILKYMQTEIPCIDDPNDYEKLLAYHTFISKQGIKKIERESLFSTCKERMTELLKACYE